MKKVIIIGAGPAGLLCALKAKNEHNEITILERNPSAGKKLLLTGNGHCNYWHDNIDSSFYVSENMDLIHNIINSDNLDNTYKYLEMLGLYPVIKNGYYYPYSNCSNSVLTLLLNACEKKNIKIIYGTLVTKIEKNNGYYLINNTYKADTLVIATGLKSYPKTGSDGILIDIISSFGHQINEIKPGLTGLKTSVYKELIGLRCNGDITLKCNGKVVREENGEIQFTDYGLSGICIMNLSNYVNKDSKILISFLPFVKDYEKFIEKRLSVIADDSIYGIFESIIHYKLLNLILKICKIDGKSKYNDLDNTKKNMLKERLLSFEFDNLSLNDFDKSQASIGGVSLRNVNLNNLESKKVNNMYFAGEVLDIVGICGGYNLANAFVTGYIVGCDIYDKS